MGACSRNWNYSNTRVANKLYKTEVVYKELYMILILLQKCQWLTKKMNSNPELLEFLKIAREKKRIEVEDE